MFTSISFLTAVVIPVTRSTLILDQKILRQKIYPVGKKFISKPHEVSPSIINAVWRFFHFPDGLKHFFFHPALLPCRRPRTLRDRFVQGGVITICFWSRFLGNLEMMSLAVVLPQHVLNLKRSPRRSSVHSVSVLTTMVERDGIHVSSADFWARAAFVCIFWEGGGSKFLKNW